MHGSLLNVPASPQGFKIPFILTSAEHSCPTGSRYMVQHAATSMPKWWQPPTHHQHHTLLSFPQFSEFMGLYFQFFFLRCTHLFIINTFIYPFVQLRSVSWSCAEARKEGRKK